MSCHFVRYPDKSKGYKFYNHSNRSFFETKNIKFIEDNRSTKVRDISFEESIDDPIEVIIIVMSNGMASIHYIMDIARPIGVVN